MESHAIAIRYPVNSRQKIMAAPDALRPTPAQHANTRLMYRRSHLASSP